MTAAVPVIALDGPSGSGKGTIARLVAGQLGWHMLDSGALYRVLALAACSHAVSLEDPQALASLARNLGVEFRAVGDNTHIILEGINVDQDVRSETCGNNASKVAALPAVREALLARQRAFRVAPGLVADGRDMGTVVFPDARLKIFLTASPEERAIRRYKQLKEKGISANLSDLSRTIQERDARDASRPVAPLQAAADAITIDTTGMGIDEVVARILSLARERGIA